MPFLEENPGGQYPYTTNKGLTHKNILSSDLKLGDPCVSPTLNILFLCRLIIFFAVFILYDNNFSVIYIRTIFLIYILTRPLELA